MLVYRKRLIRSNYHHYIHIYIYILLPGFEARAGSRFKASINNQCGTWFPNETNNSSGRVASHKKERGTFNNLNERLSYAAAYEREKEARFNENEIKVFPIPVIDNISVEYSLRVESTVDIHIQDSRGRKVGYSVKYNLKEPGIHAENLDLSELQQGVYFLMVRTGINLNVVKIIKL